MNENLDQYLSLNQYGDFFKQNEKSEYNQNQNRNFQNEVL